MSDSDTDGPRPVVPRARIEIEGHYYGGAYWDSSEFTLVLDAPTPSDPASPITVSMEDASGNAVDTVTLTVDQARAVIALDATDTSGSVPGVQRIVRQYVWRFGDTTRAYAEVTDFAEIQEWLRYAVGDQTWDYEESGDEWEY